MSKINALVQGTYYRLGLTWGLTALLGLFLGLFGGLVIVRGDRAWHQVQSCREVHMFTSLKYYSIKPLPNMKSLWYSPSGCSWVFRTVIWCLSYWSQWHHKKKMKKGNYLDAKSELAIDIVNIINSNHAKLRRISLITTS